MRKISSKLNPNEMKGIHINEVQVIPVKPRDGLAAFASCVINFFHPITKEVGEMIKKAIVSKYVQISDRGEKSYET